MSTGRSLDLHLPDDPLARFQDIYAALNTERGWFEDASSLRFTAVSALCCPGSPAAVARDIRQVSDAIKAEAGWFGTLNSSLRFIVAALLVQHGDSASAFLAEVRRVREKFREARLRRDQTHETIAILVLRLAAGQHAVSTTTVRRFQELYQEMKRHHWWLTGPDDFPACAALCGHDGTPRAIGRRAEDIYQALRGAGFSKGDPLQTAANLLCLSALPAERAAHHYRDLAEGFRQAGVSIWQSDYDELAILSFLDHPASRVVKQVLEHREAMAALKPRPDRQLTFNLAASTTFLDLVRMDPDHRRITDAKALMDMQAIIAAQQAAAAAAGASAAVVASSS